MTKDPYRRWAWMYGRWIEPLLHPIKREIIRECLGAGVKRVLDSGSGPGTFCALLQRSGIQAIALDQSPSMIGIFQNARLGIFSRIRGRGECLPFSSHSFEGVILSLVLHENTHSIRKQILREAERVLTPNGWIFILDYHLPKNFLGRIASILEYGIERAVGGEHFSNYRKFMSEGGLAGLFLPLPCTKEAVHRQNLVFGSLALWRLPVNRIILK